MSGTSITIDWKTAKNGDKSYYLTIGDSNKYPIEQFDVDEQGRGLIFFPCVYYPKSLYDMLGDHAEGVFGIIEKLADWGKVAVIEDERMPNLYGIPRLMEYKNCHHTVVDGSMVLVWDKENGEAHLEVCVKK